MTEKLTWNQIKQQYTSEWVELVDFDWDETEPEPQAGVVRVHSKNRKEFDKLMCQGGDKESAIVYTGKLMDLPQDAFFNANQHQYFQRK